MRILRRSRLGQLLGESGGILHWLIAVLRWPVGALFLGLAVGIIARFAPVEHRGKRWASVGATLIVVAWLVESAIYAWFLRDFADYKSAAGNLLLLMVVVTYLYVSSIVFLVGAQLDEFLREEAKGRRGDRDPRARAPRLLARRVLHISQRVHSRVESAARSSRSERKSHPQRRPLRLRTYVPLWLLSAQSS